MDIVEFHSVCLVNGIILSDEQLEMFNRYKNELIYWNEKVNLISRKDTENIFLNHFLHSLTILKYIEIPPKSECIDIGTGGGFPGLPMKIARPDIRMVLVDSIAKKINLTSMFAQHTGLKDIYAVKSRAEELSANDKYCKKFNFAFARAVTTISNIVKWSQRLLKPGGNIVMLKGGNLDNEIIEAKKLIKGIKIEEIQIKIKMIDWFELDEKKIVIVRIQD